MSETIRFIFGCATALLVVSVIGGLMYGCQVSQTQLTKVCIEQGGIWDQQGAIGRCIWSREEHAP